MFLIFLYIYIYISAFAVVRCVLLLFPMFIFWCLPEGSDLRTDDGKLAETPPFLVIVWIRALIVV